MRFHIPCRHFLTGVLLLPLPLGALADEADRIILGGSQNQSTFMQPAAEEGASGAMIGFDAATMAAFRGCEITEFRIDLDRATGKDSLRVFVAKGVDETPLAEWTLTGEKSGWNTIVPPQPFRIPDDGPLILGYEVKGMRYLKYSSRLMDCHEYTLEQNQEWRTWDKPDLSISFYAVVKGERLPAENAVMAASRLPQYAWQGQTMRIGGEFINLGTASITDLTVATWLDGEKWAENSVEGLKVGPREKGTFKFEVPAPEGETTAPLCFTVERVNGNADASPADNRSRTSQVRSSACFVPRKILLEVFSTENCTNCPGVHKSIDIFAEGRTDIIEIVHHAGFLTDKFTLPESEEYLWFYPTDKVYAPAVMFDRTNFRPNLPAIYSDNTPITSVTLAGLKEQYAEASELPAFFSLVLNAEADREHRTLDLCIEGTPLLEPPHADGLRLNVCIVEDSIASKTQRGASGTYWHAEVLRKVLTGTWGEPIDGNDFSRTYHLDIPEEWRMEHCRVVAFVGRGNEWGNSCAEVLVAESADVSSILAGVASPAISRRSPQRILHHGGSMPVGPHTTVYDLLGRRVPNLENAPEGIYLIR